MRMQVIRAAEGDTTERTGAAIFTGGPVWGRALAGGSADAGGEFSASVVSFSAGARTHLHRHSSEQLLYVVQGIGKVGTRAEEQVITIGDFVVIPAHEDHWHGAGDTGSPMSHLTITRSGSETEVLSEHVSR